MSNLSVIQLTPVYSCIYLAICEDYADLRTGCALKFILRNTSVYSYIL